MQIEQHAYSIYTYGMMDYTRVIVQKEIAIKVPIPITSVVNKHLINDKIIVGEYALLERLVYRCIQGGHTHDLP